MARKTFISYKYSEAQDLRNEILKALGDDTTYYQGETAESPDLTDTTTDNIKKNLTDMMFDTSVTIVVVSPNLKKSNWVNWEIEYSLKEISRKGRASKTNGVVGVIQKVNGGYDWLVTKSNKNDGCIVRNYNTDKLYSIILKNRFNHKDNVFACASCKSYDQLNGSYISLINEDEFLHNPNKYIENAYVKSENAGDFNLYKQR